jgi:cytochrome b subunit of formate dehydrogenase
MVLAVATIAWIALVSWVVTAVGGFVMLAIWLSRGGMRQRESGRIRPALILSHFLLAATGLVIWIVYVATDTDALAWIALAILGVVALLGFTMFFIWAGQRQRAAGTVEAHIAGPNPGEPAEQHFPVTIVAVHGLLAVATVILVLLTAAGVGGS